MFKKKKKKNYKKKKLKFKMWNIKNLIKPLK